MAEQLVFPPSMAASLGPYLPSLMDVSSRTQVRDIEGASDRNLGRRRPWTTLTFATSLDSSLALAPGVRTILSGPDSKAMTHFLRSRHDGILVGVGTVIADDPGLNCRIKGSQRHPRPLVLDPRLRWDLTADSKVMQLASTGAGLAPWIITSVHVDNIAQEKKELLRDHGGKYIHVPSSSGTYEWTTLLEVLWGNGLESIMVEGGGGVINSLLAVEGQVHVDSVVLTIAPTWLGKGGVVVSPDRQSPALSAARLRDVKWLPMGEDVVLCGRLGG